MKALGIIALFAVIGCAGMRAGVFGGYADNDGVIEGTPSGGPIPFEGGGGFGGIFLSGELTAPSKPRRAPIARLYDEAEGEGSESKDGFEFNSPLAYAMYLALLAVAGAITKAFAGKPPTEG